jgi:O-antigen ligase
MARGTAAHGSESQRWARAQACACVRVGVTVTALDVPRLRARGVAVAGGVLALAAGGAAAVAPLQALTATLALGFVGLAFIDLAAGLTAFTLLVFLELIPAVSASGVTPTKVAGAVLVLAAVRQRGRRFLAREHPLLWYVGLALAVWAFASTLWAGSVGVAASQAYRLALGFLLVTIVVAAVRERRHVLWLVGAYVVGGLVAAVVGFLTTSADPAGGVSRLGGAAGDPNELAAVLIPALALVGFALGVVRGTIPRLAVGSLAMTLALAIFLTQSRGGLVALAVTLVAAIVLGGPIRPYLVAITLAVAAAGLTYFVLVAPPEVNERLMHPSGGSGRTELWQVAARAFDDHPVTGVGAGNFPLVAPRYAAETIDLSEPRLIVDDPHVVHNTYLDVLAELGAVGLLLFAAFVLGLLRLAAVAVKGFARTGDQELELLSRGLLVGTLGMLAAFFFISGQYEKQLWLLLGLGAALESLMRTAAARPVSPTAGSVGSSLPLPADRRSAASSSPPA